jgi:uncharacterized Zn finger protein (UPF0148 family)
MAFCSKCGTKLTEGAKFCPKCGNSVQPTEEKPKSIVDAFKEGWQQGTKESQNKPSENDSLNTWEKIALGVSGFIALSGIWGGFANGLWIVAIISLCAIGAICAVFMGTIEKKYAWTTAIVSFLVVCGAIGASTDDDKEEKQKQAQTEQKQNEEAEATDTTTTYEAETTYEVQDLNWLQGHWVYRQGDYEAHLVIIDNTVRQYSTLNPEPTYYTYSVDGNKLYVKPLKNDGTDFVTTLDLQNHRIDYGDGNWMHKIN